MNIKELKNYIQNLENEHGNIDDVTINFRWSQDSDVHVCNFVEEDLYKEDNKTLDTICFLTDNEESE